VSVDRLTLRAGSISEAEARRLAQLVALAIGRLPKPPQSVDAATLRVDVPPKTGRGVAEIADAVAAAIAEALRIEAVS
jgi:hypothetical protein